MNSSKWDNKICMNENEYYQKIKHLGDGSFSTVSLYRKVNINRNESHLVALKKLNTESLDHDQINLVINEIKIISILHHENIIKYYGSFLYHNRFYIETEYADAGTLADFLASLFSPLEEIEILALFVQIVSAVLYLHQRNIIHRDIKTSNIFLNKQGFIKIGDFGISKILDSRLEARSFVGTPFYLCPEICEGKSYNMPCDIWALGCVLYEMASLHKTFDAGNILSLMQKIIKGTYTPINGKYSKRFQKLVKNMLQTNPSKRLNAQQLLEKVIALLNKLSSEEVTIWNGSSVKDIYATESLREYIKKKSSNTTVRCSHLYCLDLFSPQLNLTPMHFPTRIHLKQLAKGKDHYIALSTDNIVFCWGRGPNGELCKGPAILNLNKPTSIDSLRNYLINKVACGHNFNVFVTKNGLVLTCGSHRSNCLGNYEKEDLFEPKLVKFLLKINIVDVSCGNEHVVAITSDGLAYAWGNNQYGQLGIRDMRLVMVKPTKVEMLENVKFNRVFCGPEATALVDHWGNLWLCGNNQHNKLALNRVNTWFGSHIVVSSDVPQRAQLPHKYKPVQVSFGPQHTVFLLENGKMMLVGSNKQGQLGQQHVKPLMGAVFSKVLHQHKVKTVAAGSTFTLAFCNNSVFFWGTRSIRPNAGENIPLLEVNDSNENTPEFVIGKCNESLMDLVQAHGPDYPIIKISEPRVVVNKIKHLAMLNYKDSIILTAQSILDLYSPQTLQKGEMNLSAVYCFHDDSIFVVIDSQLNQEQPSIEIVDVLQQNVNFDPLNEETSTKLSYAWMNNI